MEDGLSRSMLEHAEDCSVGHSRPNRLLAPDALLAHVAPSIKCPATKPQQGFEMTADSWVMLLIVFVGVVLILYAVRTTRRSF